jgi:hypothetical protein
VFVGGGVAAGFGGEVAAEAEHVRLMWNSA